MMRVPIIQLKDNTRVVVGEGEVRRESDGGFFIAGEITDPEIFDMFQRGTMDNLSVGFDGSPSEKLEITYEDRCEVWTYAERIVDTVVEQHPLTPLRSQNGFYTTTFSAADQRVDLIIKVAEWLMDTKKEDND